MTFNTGSFSPPINQNADLEQKFNSNGTSGGLLTIFDLEKNLITSINDFYAKYATYVRCSGNISSDATYMSDRYQNNIRSNLNAGDKCSDLSGVTKLILDNAFNDVKTKANALRLASNSLGSSGGMSKSDYSSKYTDTIDKNSKNVALRGDLDLKLKELFKTDDSKFHESKLIYDSTMYTGIAWTILATSCLYYVFVNL